MRIGSKSLQIFSEIREEQAQRKKDIEKNQIPEKEGGSQN